MGNKFFGYIKIFLMIILIFSVSMILVYQIPNSALKPHYQKSAEQIGKEDTYANFLFNSDASLLDNFMDKLMLDTSMISENYDNLIRAAFDNNGYPRYWNGYLVTLRPLLTQFSYQQIRYISMIIMILLFCFCFSDIRAEFGNVMAFGFALSIIMCFLIFIGESLQYFSVFAILFSEILCLYHFPFAKKEENQGILFFAAGMAVNFFDMLTAPLLTLGIPLILSVCRKNREKQFRTLPEILKDIFVLSISWGTGYACCWIAKWAIGSLILGTDLFSDALNTAKFRIGGNEAYPPNRFLMLKLNFETYFFAKGKKPFIFIAAALFLLILDLIRQRKTVRAKDLCALLLIGALPYIWFSVFLNHSQLHYFYTYRIQAITLFSFFAVISSAQQKE